MPNPLSIYLTFVAGIVVILVVLWETFETVVLPRTVSRRFRFTRLFYLSLWKAWRGIGRRLSWDGWQEKLLGVFGPLSLILLLALWAVTLLVAFGMIQWSLERIGGSNWPHHSFAIDLYLSGVTLFTLGFGDYTPHTGPTRIAAVVEAGFGLGFFAIVIGYLPVIYQSFSRREVGISLLDARAGSPPTAVELIRRHGANMHADLLQQFLHDWERWAADVLESHLSYPVLAYYRSQHDRESWLASLTTVMDACVLLSLKYRTDTSWTATLQWQAQMTYAMCRHVCVDLALIFNTAPVPPEQSRLTSQDWATARASLIASGVPLAEMEGEEEQLAALRRQYEPYVNALAKHFAVPLPPFFLPNIEADDWQRSAWESLHKL